MTNWWFITTKVQKLKIKNLFKVQIRVFQRGANRRPLGENQQGGELKLVAMNLN